MSPEEVIADESRRLFPIPPPSASDAETVLVHRLIADRVLDALKQAGYTVVALPKPAEMGRFYYRGLNFVHADSDGLVITDRGTTFGDADEAREMAAALLAAADAAEES